MKGTVYSPDPLTPERITALEATFPGVLAKLKVRGKPGDAFSHLVLGLVNALRRGVLASARPIKEINAKVLAANAIVGLVVDHEGEAARSTLLAIHRELGGVLLLEGEQAVIRDQ